MNSANESDYLSLQHTYEGQVAIKSNLTEDTLQYQDNSDRILQLGLSLYTYYTPLLCIFGILGNSLAIIVFLKDPTYKKLSSSYFLSALAVSDSLYLINLFVVWVGSLTLGVITNVFVCPLVMYIGQLTPFVTVYLTMAYSTERYIAINYPFLRPQICTITNAKLTIAAIVAVGLVAFCYAWFVAEVKTYPTMYGTEKVCEVAKRFHKISEVSNYLDTVFVLIIPFVAITFLNLKVVIKVCQEGGRYRMFRSNQRSASVSFTNGNSVSRNNDQAIELPIIDHRARDLLQMLQVLFAFMDGYNIILQYDIRNFQRSVPRAHRLSEAKITVTLFLVSSVFLALNLPVHVLRCAQFLQQSSRVDIEKLKFTASLHPWVLMLFNTSFAVNLLLYCFSGSKFRNSLRKIFTRNANQNSPIIQL